MRAALPAWVLARVIVLGTWLLAVRLWPEPDVAGPLSDIKSLQVWDVVLYRILGESGYGAHGPMESRFFPLLPAAVGVGDFFGLPGLAMDHRCVLDRRTRVRGDSAPTDVHRNR